MNLDLDIDPHSLNEALILRAPLSGKKPMVTLVSEIVVEQLKTKLESRASSGEWLQSNVHHAPGPKISPREKSSLFGLVENGLIDLGDLEISIATKFPASLEVSVPRHLKLQEPPRIKDKQLKNRYRYDVRIRWLQLLSQTLLPARNALGRDCQCPTGILVPMLDGVWDWALSFDCKVCGNAYFCTCFRKAFELRLAEAQRQKSHYCKEGWPWRFISLYQKARWRDGICHLCSNVPSELFFCHPMYGSPVLVRYGPYVLRTAAEKNTGQRDAENEVRDRLGIPRIGEQWLTEVELLKIIRHIFRDREVLHQATAKWLGRQRLDIFVPSLKLGVEYQGSQHFEPVDYFGGETGLYENRVRDERKASLCAEQGVTLVYFRYDEALSVELVEFRIREALASRPSQS